MGEYYLLRQCFKCLIDTYIDTLFCIYIVLHAMAILIKDKVRFQISGFGSTHSY